MLSIRSKRPQGSLPSLECVGSSRGRINILLRKPTKRRSCRWLRLVSPAPKLKLLLLCRSRISRLHLVPCRRPAAVTVFASGSPVQSSSEETKRRFRSWAGPEFYSSMSRLAALGPFCGSSSGIFWVPCIRSRQT
jgi:hypothetical protein